MAHHDDLHEDQSIFLVDACLAQSNLHMPLDLVHNLVKEDSHSSLLKSVVWIEVSNSILGFDNLVCPSVGGPLPSGPSLYIHWAEIMYGRTKLIY